MIKPVSTISLKWDPSIWRPATHFAANVTATGAREGWVDRGPAGLFGGRWIDADHSSRLTRERLDSFIALCNSDAVQAVTNTFRRNADFDHRVRAGEVALFVDNVGLKQDLRWRGRLDGAPQAILDVIAAATAVRTSAFSFWR